MEILTSKTELALALNHQKNNSNALGFVPTMGALHEGHLSLVKIAKELTDTVVASIFVNPTQFTNAADLEKYPRPIERDIELLKNSNCDYLFLPAVDEIYSPGEQWQLDLGEIEGILEGKYRPGHYQGVTQIVKKLLDVIQPDLVFLGQKDFQQVMVLEHMVKSLGIPVELVMCPIIRESDGLALSSRNIHLSASARKNALVLSRSLFETKYQFQYQSVEELKKNAWELLKNEEGVVPEYFEICDANTLQSVISKDAESIIALVAAKVGETRLLDNIILK
ncbi:MAG TPA: pantoate--beta-alanine ligase [Pedobacter sp.]